VLPPTRLLRRLCAGVGHDFGGAAGDVKALLCGLVLKETRLRSTMHPLLPRIALRTIRQARSDWGLNRTDWGLETSVSLARGKPWAGWAPSSGGGRGWSLGSGLRPERVLHVAALRAGPTDEVGLAADRRPLESDCVWLQLLVQVPELVGKAGRDSTVKPHLTSSVAAAAVVAHAKVTCR